jgi:hypothetical protein
VAVQFVNDPRGRASYVGDVAHGVLDPAPVALFFESAPMGETP